MKFILEIELDTDAFQGEGYFELRRCLRHASSLLAATEENFSAGDSHIIIDSNGNTVGVWRIEQ